MRKILLGLLIGLTLVQPAKAQSPVWGAFHSIHTTISNGTESLAQITDNLRMYYDFASTVDHDYMMTNSEWLQTINEVSAYQNLSDFVYFAGYEWEGAGSGYSHISAFFVGAPPSVIANGHDRSYDTFDKFATWLSQNNGMGCIAHPMLYGPVDWSDPGVRNEQIYPCVEMLNLDYYQWSDQWICAEGSGCTTYNNPSPGREPYWFGSVKNALDRGLRLGFVAGWDYVGAYPGTPTAYTGLVDATGWTNEAVTEAVRKRHTWAAEDRIVMNVTSGPYIMGDAFVASQEVVPIDYDISAVSGKTIAQLNVFVDGVITQVLKFSEQENVFGGVDLGLSVDKHYVFLEAIQSDGKRAWSSPMYITVPTPCGSVFTWEGRVSTFSDDAEEALSGEMYLMSSDLELVDDPEWWGVDQVVGIRFSGVDIPQGATIHSAYIQFKVDEVSSEATSLEIVGEDGDNAATFTTSARNLSSRARTSAEVYWSPVAWTTVGLAGPDQRTPDLSSILDEIINRPGWTSGNSMAFITTGTGKRVAVAYDGGPTGAPLLHVEYSDACPANNPVPVATSLSPSSATAGGGAFTLTVNGSNFIQGSVVRWNGSDRTTTYVSGTQLAASISTGDIGTAGAASVTVFNPTPGGGISSTQTFTITNPVPTITTLSPNSATAGGGAITLTVNGRNFVSGAVVRWNGTSKTTTFVSSTQLTGAIPASDIAVAGTYPVTVENPGGVASTGVNFTVNNPVPAITGLSLSSTTAGGSAFTLTVNGTNFVRASVVRWNGSDRTTTYVSGTQLTASIRAGDIGTAGTASLTVFNPTPGGGSSSTQTFTITNPVPTITTLSPNSATAGGGAFTLTVNGWNFVSGAVVRWNGTSKTTTFVSSTQLAAAIPASDTAVAGPVLVAAYNPAPGGGSSNALTFTVNQSVPANMHIGDLDGMSRRAGLRWWTATVTIRVHDENHNPVQMATVKGTWSGQISITNSCTTDITGSCSVTTSKLGSSTSPVTFTVTNVTHTSLLYAPTDNHDPDGESNGTFIVVSKPK